LPVTTAKPPSATALNGKRADDGFALPSYTTPGDTTLSKILEGKICSDAQFDAETADLIFFFGKTIKLQIFNFTEYEIWDVRFPDGSRELSSYALK
jgi:hypothetical protein